MMTDPQTLFNVLFAIAGTLSGFILNSLWTAMRDLQLADKELAEKVGRIEILVAGEYVKRDDLDRHLAAIFVKLESIDTKLDRKVDK